MSKKFVGNIGSHSELGETEGVYESAGVEQRVVSDFLTKADAAQVLGITPDAVIFLEKKGHLPATRTKGGVRLFKAEDVARLATLRDLRRLEALRAAQAGRS